MAAAVESVSQLHSAQANTVQTFHMFARLPGEVQDIIWQSAINSVGQRIVDIIGYSPRKSVRYAPHTVYYGSHCPIPSLLHACRRSRHLALKRWKLCFAVEGHPARIFFDLSDDILYFGECIYSLTHFQAHVNAADREALHKVALDMEYSMEDEGIAEQVHQGMPALSDVMFVREEDEDFDCPEKSVFSLREFRTDYNELQLETFRNVYHEREWPCPELRSIELHRSSLIP
jgi:hypothetical protein